ncbi:MAG: toxin-antitoxin system HicB family antitoxin, partial [Pirellulaceae bacterium]|nr:toxin-antitoxin system HicB family antitoxin [Pirellulaceae bacterium]
GDGFIPQLFPSNEDFGNFLRCDQYYQIQMMLTALRSRDLPENDPNDPQRMITVRLPKSLHEALCEEALRLGISVNRLCISRMLQLLDPKMIPETGTKPRGRKPRARTSAKSAAAPATQPTSTTTYS